MYLFLEREERRGKEKERNIDVREKHRCERETSTGCLFHMPQLVPNPQLRHVSQLGIEPVNFHFAEQCTTKQLGHNSQGALVFKKIIYKHLKVNCQSDDLITYVLNIYYRQDMVIDIVRASLGIRGLFLPSRRLGSCKGET